MIIIEFVTSLIGLESNLDNSFLIIFVLYVIMAVYIYIINLQLKTQLNDYKIDTDKHIRELRGDIKDVLDEVKTIYGLVNRVAGKLDL